MTAILKKCITLIMLVLAFVLTACSNNENDPIQTNVTQNVMQDGVWEGTGKGRNGMILVSITVVDNTITDAKVISQSESSFAQDCINTIINNAIGRHAPMTVEVDGVTGATLTSTGVITALNMAINAAKGQDTQNETEYCDATCDVVIVGAGGAGLSAAIAAADIGSNVIVLEKQGIIGGNTNNSTGGINASETSVQKGLGIEDSNDLFYKDIMEGGHYLNTPELVRSLVVNSAPTIDWLISLGADLTDVGLMGGSSVKRTHRPNGGLAIGSHLMKILKEASANKNIDIRTNNKVTGLISDNGTVKGVVVEQKNGKTYRINARATIIATGGFGANIEMVTSYQPRMKGFSTLNHKGATGDAFAWVQAVGGNLVLMEQIQIHPTSEVENHLLITEAVRGNGAILVNKKGNRFVNEMDTRDIVSNAILSQEDSVAYLVFDQGVRTSLASIETYASQGLLKIGDTTYDLAQNISVDGLTLTSSIERYNSFQKSGIDSDFGRTALQMTANLNNPSYYAVCVTPAIHHTMGGLHVDPDMHVLKADGTIIPGLFAAGEVTGGLHGGNRLGGNGVADIVVNGKIAGTSAANY